MLPRIQRNSARLHGSWCFLLLSPLLPSSFSLHCFCFSNISLPLEKPVKPFPIPVDQLVGVNLDKTDENKASLTIYFWDTSRKGKTQVAEVVLDFTSPPNAEQLKDQLLEAMPHCTFWLLYLFLSLIDLQLPIAKTSIKKVVVIINGVSGKKKAEGIFEKYAKPVLKANHVEMIVKGSLFSQREREREREREQTKITNLTSAWK